MFVLINNEDNIFNAFLRGRVLNFRVSSLIWTFSELQVNKVQINLLDSDPFVFADCRCQCIWCFFFFFCTPKTTSYWSFRVNSPKPNTHQTNEFINSEILKFLIFSGPLLSLPYRRRKKRTSTIFSTKKTWCTWKRNSM